MKTMRAIVIDKPTKAEDIVFSEVPIPEVKPGWVLVKIMAFGLNHSEQLLRESEIEQNYIKKPVIPGIECVGVIEDASDSGLAVGQKVVSLMGGMGRSFDGSYAEYALLPLHHVFPVESSMGWEEMGAVPETYYTAWGSLMQRLQLKPEDKLLIRGATCALGYVSIQLAKALGCKVAATTHREKYFPLLQEVGADECILDTMQAVQPSGIVCHTGVLGNVFSFRGFSPLNHIPNGVYLTGFHSNYPTAKDMQDIFSFMDEHKLKPLCGAVYDFDDLKQALIDLDGHKVQGKIVMRMK